MRKILHPGLQRGHRAERAATLLFFVLLLVLLGALAGGIHSLRL